MSGETEREVSGWTVNTLHSHILRLLHEKDRQYEQRFQAQQNAVSLSLAAAEKAVVKAEMASEKRFEGINEFRAALNDAARNNVTRGEYDTAQGNLAEKLQALTTRFERLESGTQGTTTGQEATRRAAAQLRTLIIGCVGVVIAAVGVAVAVIKV